MNRTRLRAIVLAAGLAFVLGANTSMADHPVKPSPVGQMVETLNPVNWRMPKWQMPKFSGILPAKEEKVRIKKKKDSLFDEVKQTASKSWQRTKEVFNPQKLNPTRFLPASAKMPSSKPPKDEPGFFGSLFAPPPAPQNPRTVTDFLGQEKPKG